MDHRELWKADGGAVTRLRRERGWSRARLAQAAGVSHHTVAKIERGEAVFPATLGAVATALGLPPSAVRAGTDAAPAPGASQRGLVDALRDRYELYQAATRSGGFELMREEFPKGLARSVRWTYATTRDLSKVGVYDGPGGVIRFFERVFADFRLGEHRVDDIVPVGRRELLARGVETFSTLDGVELVSNWMHLCRYDRRGRLMACHCSTDVRPLEPSAARTTAVRP